MSRLFYGARYRCRKQPGCISRQIPFCRPDHRQGGGGLLTPTPPPFLAESGIRMQHRHGYGVFASTPHSNAECRHSAFQCRVPAHSNAEYRHSAFQCRVAALRIPMLSASTPHSNAECWHSAFQCRVPALQSRVLAGCLAGWWGEASQRSGVSIVWF